ncbi:hypothetical protein FB570_11999 [Streptomyces sp. T12]|uniref:hypothetical protein n=1 Tax=Streptomyces sp. T12 TaxID=477697 RepID=UPI0011ABD477|nr:hypothetical protein [Streptomyces sp. T12]TWD13172.1 hypothetical protein FB570_11999 [Streptomyces sp. T12]
MGWKGAFGDAMKELEAIRQQLARLDRLDDPTVGLTALHGDVTQSRLKILEQLQAGVTGLREENREVRRRQDRMISDLNETRGELRQLLDLVDVLRPFAPPEGTGEVTQTHTKGTAQPPEPVAGHGSSARAEGHPSVSTDTDSQGGTMENTRPRPQPESGDDQDLALKSAIEAAYQGIGTSAGQPSAAMPQAAGAEDPQVAHGVLLLKAAGVASAELIAHRDTWEWLAALAVDHSHFRTPPSVEDIKEGRVQTVLSGRSLIALLIELWNTRSTATPLQGDWALAMTTYNRIAAELNDVTGQGETIRIVLDDGLPHEAGD